MPIYDFKCPDPDCGNKFEAVVAKGIIECTCPVCKAIAIRIFTQGSAKGTSYRFNWFESE